MCVCERETVYVGVGGVRWSRRAHKCEGLPGGQRSEVSALAFSSTTLGDLGTELRLSVQHSEAFISFGIWAGVEEAGACVV